MGVSGGHADSDDADEAVVGTVTVRIIEHDPSGALHIEGIVGNVRIEVITNYRREGDRAYLDELHIDGPGRSALGPRLLRTFVRELGHQIGARVVIIQGGIRTTGARPGRRPRPIVIEVG
jgi:hypothetical protein